MSSDKELPLYRKAWAVLTRRERRRAMLQLFLLCIGVGLEALGIGLIVPAMMLFTQNDIESQFPAVQPLLEMLGNPSQQQLIVGGMVLLVGVFLVKSVYLGLLYWYQNRFAFGIRVRLAEQLFQTYLRQPYVFHLQSNSALLVRNTQAETMQFVQNGVKPAMTLVSELLLILALGVLLLFVEPVGALVVAGVLGLAAWSFHYFTRKRIVQWGQSRRTHDGFRLKHVQQGLGSVKDIKLLGREKEFLAAYRRHNVGSAVAAQKQATFNQLPRLWLELLAVAGLATLVVTMVLQGREMSAVLPVLGAFGAAAYRLLPSMNKVLTSIQMMRFAVPVLEGMYQELQLPAPELPKRKLGAGVVSFRREIRAEAVTFVYPGTGAPALRDVSFSVAKGDTAGFIGPSGSGKSTLIDVMLGMLAPDSGRMTVDGEDIRKDIRRWQDQIGYVPQSIYLTDDTLRRNIAFGIPEKEIDDEAVRRAAHAAKLDEFIASLPEGLETVVGERGVRLSGGQRQRIGIARSLYHDPPVLVLDEATSALDTETEREVMKAIYALHGEKTILIVAHRLSTVEHCDYIVRLEDGRIAEVGPPGAVLSGARESTYALGAGG